MPGGVPGASVSRPFAKIDFLMHFGGALAPFWLPLAPFWLPLFGSFLVPFGSLLVPFGSPFAPFLLTFIHLGGPFSYVWRLLASFLGPSHYFISDENQMKINPKSSESMKIEAKSNKINETLFKTRNKSMRIESKA